MTPHRSILIFTGTEMSRTSTIIENDNTTYICARCGRSVSPLEGGNRNHCPFCLWSLHVDLRKGDRRCGCRGLMEPVSVWVKPSGEWALIHRCCSCGFLRSNRIAADDSETLLLAMAARPIAMLPFPAERIMGKIL